MILKRLKSLNRKFNNKGFSLIELMVVVAIIGILAAIGIPQYSKFQAKTRQTEAKSSLSALFASEASFMAEWNQYTKDLHNVGFGVTGTRLRYVTGFTAAAGCTNYVTTGGAPAEVANLSNTWSCGANVNITNASQATNWQLVGFTVDANHQCTAVPAPPTNANANTACIATTGSQSFVAVAMGDPNANVTGVPDGWTINDKKLLSNSDPGIK